MIDFNVISEIVESSLESDIEELCHSVFEEKPEFHPDEDLDETYVIMEDTGVSILFDEGGNFECLFFHFDFSYFTFGTCIAISHVFNLQRNDRGNWKT